jgi:hypothetical protein
MFNVIVEWNARNFGGCECALATRLLVDKGLMQVIHDSYCGIDLPCNDKGSMQGLSKAFPRVPLLLGFVQDRFHMGQSPGS